MKKITVAILAVIYLIVSSGVAMSIHHCMGKVASIDLMHNSAECNKCGMKLTRDCCSDEFKIVKLTDSHKLIYNDIKINAPGAIINSKGIFDVNLFSSGYSSAYKSHSSPGHPNISLNILYCVFRI